LLPKTNRVVILGEQYAAPVEPTLGCSTILRKEVADYRLQLGIPMAPLFQQPEAAAQRTSLAVGKVLERTGCSRRASRPNRKFVLNFLVFPVEGLRIALEQTTACPATYAEGRGIRDAYRRVTD
jgi:hypothetical protein